MRDKFLTEAMGECWHEWTKTRETTKLYTCPKCNDSTYKKFQNNDFSTWEGFGKLWGWAQKQEWFEELTDHCEYNRMFHQKWSHQVLPEIIHPDRFADAVYEYLKERKE